MIGFTGSVAAGKKIAAAARRLKNMVFELGGNDAAIVLDDVDVKKVAPKIYGSAMGGTGQICAAPSASTCTSRSTTRWSTNSPTSLSEPDARTAMGRSAPRPQYERVDELVEDAARRQGGHRRRARRRPGLLLPADDHHQRPPGRAGGRRGAVRPGAAGHAVQRRRLGDRPGQLHRVRPVRLGVDSDVAAARSSPPVSSAARRG